MFLLITKRNFYCSELIDFYCHGIAKTINFKHIISGNISIRFWRQYVLLFASITAILLLKEKVPADIWFLVGCS